MPRPKKCRRIGFVPQITFFRPAGIPMRRLGAVILSIEELEAIRLKDHKNLDQEESAGTMGISRATFQRVLLSAREKIADALINGKAIRFEGGDFEIDRERFRCGWDEDKVESTIKGEIADEELEICFMCHRMGGERKRCRRGHGWRGLPPDDLYHISEDKKRR